MKYYKILLFLFAFTLLFSCRKGKNIPDVSQIEADVEIKRFEKALFALDTSNIDAGLDELRGDFPFTDFFIDFALAYNMLPPSVKDTLSRAKIVKGFVSEPSVIALYDTVMARYADLSNIEEELEQGFKFYKHYFPQRAAPQIYSMLSEYYTAVLIPPTDESAVIVSLDLFFGPSYELYYNPPINLPKYIVRSLTREHIPAYIFRGVVDDIAGEVKSEKLLDIMIHNGKKLYILDQLMPYTPDSILMGYSSEQIQWVEDNEAQMWTHFISDELLYSEEAEKIRKLVEQSPTSPGMPPESPGRTANWVGWKIIESYMKQKPETTMELLLQDKDAQRILSEAKYRP